MKKATKYLSIILFFVALTITSLYSFFATSLILKYVSTFTGLIVSLFLFLIFSILAIVFRRSRYGDPALWAGAIVFFVSAIGLFSQWLYEKAIGDMGIFLFVLIGFALIYMMVFIGVININKAVKGTVM